MKKILSTVLVLIALLILAVPALAQTSHTLTLTEDEINDSYRVTNPPRRSISNVQVDLQPGQVVITATMTTRGRNPVALSATFVPTVTNGHITWTASTATADGQPASGDLLNQINNSITSSWRNYFKKHGETGRVTGITITDTEATVTYTTR